MMVTCVCVCRWLHVCLCLQIFVCLCLYEDTCVSVQVFMFVWHSPSSLNLRCTPKDGSMTVTQVCVCNKTKQNKRTSDGVAPGGPPSKEIRLTHQRKAFSSVPHLVSVSPIQCPQSCHARRAHTLLFLLVLFAFVCQSFFWYLYLLFIIIHCGYR